MVQYSSSPLALSLGNISEIAVKRTRHVAGFSLLRSFFYIFMTFSPKSISKNLTLRHILVLFFVSALVLAVHVGATLFYWYDAIPYFDKFVHFLGGAWWGYFFMFARVGEDSKVRLIHVLISVFAIGVMWEAYEYSYQAYYHTFGIASPMDSLDDLIFDVLGGAAAVFSIHLKRFLK